MYAHEIYTCRGHVSHKRVSYSLSIWDFRLYCRQLTLIAESYLPQVILDSHGDGCSDGELSNTRAKSDEEQRPKSLLSGNSRPRLAMAQRRRSANLIRRRVSLGQILQVSWQHNRTKIRSELTLLLTH